MAFSFFWKVTIPFLAYFLDIESCESLSADEEFPMNSSGSQSWSWGLKGIPCNWRFLQNDCLQLPCRALHGWVTRAILDCLLGEFRHVKSTCVLHNFMRTDTRTRRGYAVRCRVPEERSAALQDVSMMGANNAAREAIRVREIFTSYFFEEGAVPWQHHRLHYAQPKALLRAIHTAIRVFFHLLSDVNCSYSIPSFSLFDFYFSGVQKQNRLF